MNALPEIPDLLPEASRRAKEAHDVAVVCRMVLVRGSDGTGGVIADDVYAWETARRIFEKSVAEVTR